FHHADKREDVIKAPLHRSIGSYRNTGRPDTPHYLRARHAPLGISKPQVLRNYILWHPDRQFI
ncbi:hypothetical protein, partial [Burkholderia sp.]|uniref:hypothetical protein n=1 Tax=Burkholderia sp. TaxID=36773 RepID=UPI0025C6959A